MAFLDSGAGDDTQTGPPPSPGGAPPGGSPGGPPGGPPGGGGPILNMLAKQNAGPQASAPGPGNTADSFLKLKMALGMMREALAGLPEGGQQYQDVVRAMQRLGRHLPQGDTTAGAEKTMIGDLMRNIMRSPMIAQINRMLASPGGGGPGQAGPSPPPMPSTPLPGA